jgi:diguanylate cyclase (GGDEF)-like protein
VRDADTVARLGGDEFVVLTEGGEKIGSALAERIMATIEEPVHFGQQQVRIRASVGVAVAHTSSVAVDTLLHQADAAMYAAKLRGRTSCIRPGDKVGTRPAEDGAPARAPRQIGTV